MRIKVQCISNKSGTYNRLELGKWYEAEEYKSRLDPSDGDSYTIYGLGNKLHPMDQDFGVYDKSLFRTLDQKRDHRLNLLEI